MFLQLFSKDLFMYLTAIFTLSEYHSGRLKCLPQLYNILLFFLKLTNIYRHKCKRFYSNICVLERCFLIDIFPFSEYVISRVCRLEIASELGSTLLTQIYSPINHILFMTKTQKCSTLMSYLH